MKGTRSAFTLPRELLFLVPTLVAWAYLHALHPFLGQDILRYALFSLGFAVLPAYALGRFLLPRSVGGFMECTCLGFPVSQGLLFLLAWGGSHFGFSWYAALALPVLGLAGLLPLGRRQQAEEDRGGTEPFVVAAGFLASGLAIWLCCLFDPLVTPLPTATAPQGFYYDDSLMVMGTFSAMKAMVSGLPFVDGRFGDIPTSYHILLFVNNGMASLVTGAHPLYVQLFLYPVLQWSMLAGGVAAACRRLAGFGRTETTLLIVLLFFGAGQDFSAFSMLQMFLYHHTYFPSLPAVMLLAIVLFAKLSGRMERLPTVYVTMLFLTASAAKSVVLLLLPLALLPVLACRALGRKLEWDDLRFAGGLLVSAVVLRLIEYQSSSQLVLKKLNLLNSVKELAITGWELLPFWLLLCLMAWSDRLSAHRVGRHRQFLLLAGSMFVLSVVLTRSIEFVGGSQYFFWYTRIFTLVGVVGCLGWALERRMRVVQAATLAVALWSAWSFCGHVRALHAKPSPAPTVQTTLDIHEWTGLLWARDNLALTARFVCNRDAFVEIRGNRTAPGRYYDFLAVSGLYGYAWPYEWLPPDTAREVNARLAVARAVWAAQTDEEREAALRRLPVEYLFVSKREAAYNFSAVPGLRKIYASPSFDIYDLRGLGPRR